MDRRTFLRRTLGLGTGLVVAESLAQADLLARFLTALKPPARRFWALDGTMVPRALAPAPPGPLARFTLTVDSIHFGPNMTLSVGDGAGNWTEVGQASKITSEMAFIHDHGTGRILRAWDTTPRVPVSPTTRANLADLIANGKVTFHAPDPPLVSEVARYPDRRRGAGGADPPPVGARRVHAPRQHPRASRRA